MNLVDEYRKQAVKYGQYTAKCDTKKVNSTHDKIMELATEILNSPQPESLRTLLDDNDEWVQLYSATHYLEVNETIASKRLRSLSKSKDPIISITASYTLKEWKNGELTRLRVKKDE